MFNAYDIAYGLGVGVSAPFWLATPSARRKVLGAFADRMGHAAPAARRKPGRPAVMVHAVSVGEMNATRALVDMLAAERPELEFVISTTTQTGYARGLELYGSRGGTSVIRYPLDFTAAVNRVLDATRPDVVVLMELEVWPNFIRACRRRGVPVVLVNGRLTPGSFRGYKRVRPVAAAMFRQLAGICVQDQTYADRFLQLGAPAGRVLITGTMKFDTAPLGAAPAGAAELAAAVGLRPGIERVLVCGSTGPGEEEIVLRVYRELLAAGRAPGLRLVIVPRKPERFDEVARLVEAMRFRVVRRSLHTDRPPPGEWREAPVPPVVLGDTMGELRTFYALADVVFVGRTLVDLGPKLHGSDMIEPAALGRPTIVGPFTANFADAMSKFRAAGAVIEVPDEAALGDALRVLLSTPAEAAAMARRAVEVVARERGATGRHAKVIFGLLDRRLRGDIAVAYKDAPPDLSA